MYCICIWTVNLHRDIRCQEIDLNLKCNGNDMWVWRSIERGYMMDGCTPTQVYVGSCPALLLPLPAPAPARVRLCGWGPWTRGRSTRMSEERTLYSAWTTWRVPVTGGNRSRRPHNYLSRRCIPYPSCQRVRSPWKRNVRKTERILSQDSPTLRCFGIV